MKNLLVSILILLCFVSFADAQGCITIGKKKSVSCTTSTDGELLNLLGTGTTDTNGSAFACNKWVVAADITITEYKARYNYQSGDGGVKVCLLPHNTGTDLPSSTTCVTGSDVTKDDSDMTAGSFIDYVHTLGTPKDIDAGTYWVCNIETGAIARYFEDHADDGERGCYGAASCSTADPNFVDASVIVYGCAR